MASRKKPSEARLKTILRRQTNPPWNSDYVPSLLATVAEAPSLSRASILTPAKLGGREVHVLSPAERSFALLGLYHPNSVGLQEQRMLSPDPCPHPLWDFPGVTGIDLPSLKGLTDVADCLGYTDMLPTIQVTVDEDPTQTMSLVFPYIGDHLWAMKGGANGIYCLDWNIKDTYKAFKCPSPKPNGKPRRQQESRLALARHELQKAYYATAKIRSLELAGEALDFHVAANLRQLFLHHRRPVELPAELKEEILEKFRAALATGVPPTEVLMIYCERGRCTLHQCRDLFFQFVWNRELRLDLFQPVLIDRPMHPEERDVIDVYADWFAEEPPCT